jgi:ADP-heptose:LPS heptosyltransferase
MNEPLQRVGDVRAIAVFRALQLGDLLCAVPALRALKRALPAARITLIGLPWAAALCARFDRYIDDFIEFPGFPGFSQRTPAVDALPRFLENVHARRFDLALQMHGDGRISNLLVSTFGARRTAGYYRRGGHCPDPELFLPWRNGDHEIERWIALLEALGAPSNGTTLEFPLDGHDYRQLDAHPRAATLAGSDYVCVHPGSQLASRGWYPERFAAVGDALAAEGLRVVLTGTAREAPLTRSVARAMRAPSLDLAGETTLGGIAALIDRARLLVSNDSGVVHVAVARGTPSVAVSCGADVKRRAPLDSALHRVLHHPVPCRPCAYQRCPIGQPCADGVETDAVVAAARSMLRRAPCAA